jgi:drug/metabolite transporter (DMT)-like permease
MNERLTLSQALLLTIYAVGMAGGQILFKNAALQYGADASSAPRLIGIVQNGYFITAIVLYAALTLFWVWLLTFTPLSRAYPFVALAFALTPLLAGLLFGETVSARLWLGLALILSGLFFVVS